MKCAPFNYHRPNSLDEAVAMLARLPDAKLLAGGQSLLPLMNFRLASPANIVSLADAQLSYIEEDENGLRIGAMTRQRMIEQSDVVRRICPLLSRAVSHVGHQQTRNRGTLGGSLCHLDPAAELPLVAAALDARLSVVGPRGLRHVDFADFARGPLETDLRDDEIVTEVYFPQLTGLVHFAEVARRKGDFAIASLALIVNGEAGGRIVSSRVAFGGLRPCPARESQIEAALAGAPLSPGTIECASRMAASLPCEASEEHPPRYRQNLASALLHRGLNDIVHQGNARDG